MTKALKKGWTTGACAAGAAKAAFWAYHSGHFPDPVAVRLPKSVVAEFPLAEADHRQDGAQAAIRKDAGDDPDITHGAIVRAYYRPIGDGLVLRAGEGVGTVTLPGLPIAVGEPSITPGPRAQVKANIEDAAQQLGVQACGEFTFSIPGGLELATKTLNPRLGIVGGLSILGTTGVVIPYSCSAWAHSIRRGIDVARALGLDHLGAATGKTSEAVMRAHHQLPDPALIDMGDMVAALLAGLRRDPPKRLTVAGGPAKLAKLAEGKTDLHSKAASADLTRLIAVAQGLGATPDQLSAMRAAPSVSAVLALAPQLDISRTIALQARQVLAASLPQSIEIDVMVVSRDGTLMASTS